MTSFIDTHCHLNHPDFADDLRQVIDRALSAGVDTFICAGYDIETSIKAMELAGSIDQIKAAVGIHPHDADTFTPEMERQIRDMASDRRNVAAIGETGLDYYRTLSPRDIQQDSFRRHIRIAHDLDLPLIIHSRDAQEDVIDVLQDEDLPARGVVMHCLPGEAEFARKSIGLGCYVGLAGTLTFKNAQEIRDIAEWLPMDRILLETDCPYLAPHPYRGKRNEPSYIPVIAGRLAEVKGISIDEVASVTTANARKLFGL
ncbi:MAG: TatD family hydrolase [Armatimonadota bacterium]